MATGKHVSYRPPLKILQIVSGRDLNGALTYCQTLTKRLVSMGHEVHVACRADCWLRTRLPGIPFIESNLNRSWSELRRVARFISDEEFDLVHTHMSRAHLFGVILRMGSQTPVVATAHSCNFQPHWRFNDFVIANSKATLNYHRRTNWVGRSSSEHVYCFTDLARFAERDAGQSHQWRTSLGVSADEYLIGMVGQVCERKGHHVLFEALPKLVAKVPRCKLVLLGPCNHDSNYVRGLKQMLAQNCLNDRVIWAGTTDDIPLSMSSFDLCVVPSIKEPLGLVAVESLAADTPVVASRTGGLPEIVQHERTGLLVNPGDSDGLARAVTRMACSPDWAKTMAHCGRCQVLDLFEPSKLAYDVASIYYRVLGVSEPQLAAAA